MLIDSKIFKPVDEPLFALQFGEEGVSRLIIYSDDGIEPTWTVLRKIQKQLRSIQKILARQ